MSFGARSMGAGAGESACSRFHHCAKVVAAQCPLLLQIGADRTQIVAGKDFGKQRAIGGAALLSWGAQAVVCAMR